MDAGHAGGDTVDRALTELDRAEERYAELQPFISGETRDREQETWLYSEYKETQDRAAELVSAVSDLSYHSAFYALQGHHYDSIRRVLHDIEVTA